MGTKQITVDEISLDQQYTIEILLAPEKHDANTASEVVRELRRERNLMSADYRQDCSIQYTDDKLIAIKIHLGSMDKVVQLGNCAKNFISLARKMYWIPV